MIEKCESMQDLMKIQIEIINNHIDEHKWFNHIEDKNIAIIDFIKKYGWIIRETYCSTCKHKDNCIIQNEIGVKNGK